MMDEALLRKVSKQLRVLNIWITIFGSLILLSFVVMIVLLFKVFTFVNDTSQKLTDLQDKTSSALDVKQQVCTNKSFSDFLNTKSDVCE